MLRVAELVAAVVLLLLILEWCSSPGSTVGAADLISRDARVDSIIVTPTTNQHQHRQRRRRRRAVLVVSPATHRDWAVRSSVFTRAPWSLVHPFEYTTKRIGDIPSNNRHLFDPPRYPTAPSRPRFHRPFSRTGSPVMSIELSPAELGFRRMSPSCALPSLPADTFNRARSVLTRD